MSDDEPVIGIDLGTTYSVVSIFQNNQVKVFQDELGNKIIPSYVFNKIIKDIKRDGKTFGIFNPLG